MRTSLLMNTGFVIGTGDVSELALGWCTYNGDHMSMYNPNVSIPKTLVKFLVRWAAENEFDGEARRDAARHRRHGDLAGAAAGRRGRRDRRRRPRRRSAPTSCTTSSCSTSCATARRRRRSCSWPGTRVRPAATRRTSCGSGCGCSCGGSSPTSSSGRACRTARRSARSACRRAATGGCPATPRRPVAVDGVVAEFVRIPSGPVGILTNSATWCVALRFAHPPTSNDAADAVSLTHHH